MNNGIYQILLYCDPEDCLTYEQAHLDYFKPEYNICLVAGSTLGYHHSVITKQKISTNHARLSGQNHPRYGSTISQTHRAKIAKLTESDVIQVRRLRKDGVSQTSLAKHFQVSQQTISDIDTGRCWR